MVYIIKLFKFCLLVVVGFSIYVVSYSIVTGPLSEEAINKRLELSGKVFTKQETNIVNEQDSKPAEVNVGLNVYKNYCSMCHDIGLAGAPKLGDRQAWSKRLEQGLDTLVSHVVNGYKAMPAKGGCMQCTEADLRKAVEYITSQ